MCSWAANSRTHDTHVSVISAPQNVLRGMVEVKEGIEGINGAGKDNKIK